MLRYIYHHISRFYKSLIGALVASSFLFVPAAAFAAGNDLQERIFFLTSRIIASQGHTTLSSMQPDGSDRKDIVELPSSLVRISDTNSDKPDAVLSPDGTKVAFEIRQDGESSTHNVALIDLSKPDSVVPLSHASTSGEQYSSPKFSPDGQKVVFWGYVENRKGINVFHRFNIYLANVDGSGFQQLTTGGSTDPNDGSPAFTSDGQHIVFWRGSSVYQMDVDGGNQQNLLANVKLPTVDGVGEPLLSPDGTKIVYAGIAKIGEEADLYLVDLKTAQVVNLTNTPSLRDSHPVFSPDSSKVLFRARLSNSIYEVGFGNGDIKIVNVDSSGQRNITSDDDYENEPVFSPDGTRIAFTSSPTIYEFLSIHTINLDGSGEKDLIPQLPSTERNYQPAWRLVKAVKSVPPPPPPPLASAFKSVKGKLVLHRGRTTLMLQGVLEPKIALGSVQLSFIVKGMKKPLLKRLVLKNGSFQARIRLNKRVGKLLRKARKGKLTLNFNGLIRDGHVEVKAAKFTQTLRPERK